jgi:hypothetical protein
MSVFSNRPFEVKRFLDEPRALPSSRSVGDVLTIVYVRGPYRSPGTEASQDGKKSGRGHVKFVCFAHSPGLNFTLKQVILDAGSD